MIIPVATPGKFLVKPLGVFCILFSVIVVTAEAHTPQYDIPVTISSAQAGATLELRFGLDPSATDGLDSSLGEQRVPPLPPGDGFAAQFVGSDIGVAMAPQQKDYRQGSLSAGGTRVHEIQIQTSETDSITIAWNLPPGVTGRLNDILIGTVRNISMKGSGSYTETFPAVFNKFRLTVIYAAPPLPPLAATGAASAVSAAGATMNGTVFPRGTATTCHFEYGTSPGYGVATPDMYAGSDTSAVKVSATILGLSPLTIYHYRVVAHSTGGTSAGADIVFFTTMDSPSLQTPTNGAINVPLGARLRWHPTPGAESYRVQVAFSARFDSIALDRSGIVDTSLQVVLVNPETIYYWHVRAQDDTLSGIWSSPAWMFKTGLSQNVHDAPSGIPQETVLEQNFPNPFNPATTIRYSLPGQVRVTLKIYNALGQCLACLVDATQEAGSHEVIFGGASLPSGVCFYRLQAGEYTCTKRLLILR